MFTQNEGAKLLLRLVGGPADGYQFSAPTAPLFLGIGDPIAGYHWYRAEKRTVEYRYADSTVEPSPRNDLTMIAFRILQDRLRAEGHRKASY
jgi:hypothetical protein